jgi:hypothetical protein
MSPTRYQFFLLDPFLFVSCEKFHWDYIFVHSQNVPMPSYSAAGAGISEILAKENKYE